MNFTQKLLEYINGLDEKEAAKRFSRTVQAVRIWKATGNVPLVIVQQIMDETGGKFGEGEVLESMPPPVVELPASSDLESSPRTGLINEGVESGSGMTIKPDGTFIASGPGTNYTAEQEFATLVNQRLEKLEAFARMMTDPDRVQGSDVRPASPQTQVPIVSGVSQTTTEIPAQIAPVYTANAPSTFIEQHVEAAENPNGVGSGWNVPYPRDNRR